MNFKQLANCGAIFNPLGDSWHVSAPWKVFTSDDAMVIAVTWSPDATEVEVLSTADGHDDVALVDKTDDFFHAYREVEE